MTSPASRAGAMVAIGSLSVLAPVLGAGTAILFGIIALVALAVPTNSRAFELLSTPSDQEVGQLRRITFFAGAAMVLAIVGTVEAFGVSTIGFVMAVLLITVGTFAESLIRSAGGTRGQATLGFTIIGALAGIIGYTGMRIAPFIPPHETYGLAILLATVGALVGGLYRIEAAREEALLLVLIAALLWFLAGIGSDVTLTGVLLAIGITVPLGIIAYTTGTASIAGMISGILLALLTFVFGGFPWFVILLAFFAIGGLATKYRYAEKAARGVAETDRGARGTANVLSNGVVPLSVVLVWASVEAYGVSHPSKIFFLLAFAGAVATALADTLASEIGALYDNPRLITTLKPVDPGTDGAVTIAGHAAGIVGAVIIAGSLLVLFPDVRTSAGFVVVLAGVVGMNADSVLGATIEGDRIGNEGVNFFATVAGATIAAGGGLVVQ